MHYFAFFFKFGEWHSGPPAGWGRESPSLLASTPVSFDRRHGSSDARQEKCPNTEKTQRETSSVAVAFGRHGMPRPPLTLAFDPLTLKLVYESHLMWGTFLPNLGTLGLWVLELFAMYRRTDGQRNAYRPLPYTVGA